MEDKERNENLSGATAPLVTYDEVRVVERTRTHKHINDLPFDVLSIIFSLVSSLHAQDRDKYRSYTYPLNRVCKHWYDVALYVPELYTRIVVQNVHSDGLESLQHYIERSGTRPLDIDIQHHNCPRECEEHETQLALVAPIVELHRILEPHIWRIARLNLIGLCDSHVEVLTSLSLRAGAASLKHFDLSPPTSNCNLFSDALVLPPQPRQCTTFNMVLPWLAMCNPPIISSLQTLDLKLPTWTRRQLILLFDFLRYQPFLQNLTLREFLPGNYRELDDMHNGEVDMVSAFLHIPLNMRELKRLSLQNLNTSRARDVLASLSFRIAAQVHLDFGGHVGYVLPSLHGAAGTPSSAFKCLFITCPRLDIRLAVLAEDDGLELKPLKTMLRYAGYQQSGGEDCSWSATWAWTSTEQSKASVLEYVDTDLLNMWETVVIRTVSIRIDSMPAARSFFRVDWARLFRTLSGITDLQVTLHSVADVDVFFSSLVQHELGPGNYPPGLVLPQLSKLSLVLVMQEPADLVDALYAGWYHLQRRQLREHKRLIDLKVDISTVAGEVDYSLASVLRLLRGSADKVVVNWNMS